MSMDAAAELFETDRLVATRIGPTDFDALCRLHRDPAVMRTLSADGNTYPDDVTRAGLEQAAEHWQRHGFGLWIFRDKAEGRFVGRGGLKHYDVAGRDEIGLAYAVISDHWGQGLATEIAAASLGIGFDRLCVASIAAWTLPINARSLRVIEKLGMRREADVVFAGLNHQFYRTTAEAWRSRSSGR